MKHILLLVFFACLVHAVLPSGLSAKGSAAAEAVAKEGDPLPSWANTAPKQAIVAFVGRVTTAGSTRVSPKPQRMAGRWSV